MKKTIYWNENTAIAFVDNLIIFSLHLSSKKERNSDQIKEMLVTLEKIK